MTYILGIETSCDDTSVAVVRDGRQILSLVTSSQDEFHAEFGGVVPEIASRRHLEILGPVWDRALSEAGVEDESIDGVAATQGPGLLGSLLVGLMAAKAYAFGRGLPFIGINHLEAHLFAARLDCDTPPEPPFLGLLVSGGHTCLCTVDRNFRFEILGSTRDDAAGEVFDKVARHIGLGFPGGRAMAEAAEMGDPSSLRLPRPMLNRAGLDFSFSGLKTAAVKAWDSGAHTVPDLAAALQEAIVDVLVKKTIRAVRDTGADTLVLAGGVSANRRLRERLRSSRALRDVSIHIPPPRLCTDNAAMVAALGAWRLANGERSTLDVNAYASLGAMSAVPR